jgi:short-subunit dehydrogenase
LTTIEAGAIISKFSENAAKNSTEVFDDPGLLYHRAADMIRSWMHMSQSDCNAMTSEAVADQIVKVLDKDQSATPIRFTVAGSAWYVKFLGFLQKWFMSHLVYKMVAKRFGLQGEW